MVGNKDFSQYLATAKGKTGASFKAAPKSTPLVKSGAGAGKGPDPLSWLVDILSRPMRAVENVPNQLLDEELKRKQAKATGTQYNEIGGAFNVLTAPLRGFFSNNPADQPTGAQIVEKQYDVSNYGKPGYVDQANNVRELQKGALGLGMDIALDPLTWIPGAQIAKGGQLALKGLKAGVEGADALVAGTNFGKAIGAGARVESRAAKAKDLAIADNQALMAQRAAQPYRLQDTAFGAKRPTEYFSAQAKFDRITSPVLKESYTVPKVGAKVPLAPVAAPTTKAEIAASKKLTEALRATPETAIPAPAVDSASILDSLGPATGSTIPEQYAAKGATDNVLAQLSLIKPTQVTTTGAKFVDTFSPNIAKLEKKLAEQEANRPFATTKTTSERFDKNIKAIKSELASLKNQREAAIAVRDTVASKSFTASGTLKNLLADPVAADGLNKALGEGVVSTLAGIKDVKKLQRATEYLGRVVRGEPVAGSSAQRDLAATLHQHYDIKVPGTEAPALQGTSNVGSEFVAEAKVANTANMNLTDTPWMGGYTPEQVDLVVAKLPEFIDGPFFLKLEGYGYTTHGGSKSTSAVMGEGVHINPWEFNQMKQYTLMEAMVADERAIIKAHNYEAEIAGMGSMKIAAGNRAAVLLDQAIKNSELALRWLDTKGVSAWFGVGENRIRLYAHQFLRELQASDKGALAMSYLNEATSIPVTNLMDVTVALYRNPAMTDAEILAMLKKKIPGAKNFLTGNKKTARFGHIPGQTKPKNILTEVNKDAKGRIKGWYVLHTQEEVASKTIAMLRGAAPSIEKVVANNEAMVGSRILAEQKDFTPQIADSIMNDIADPEQFGQSVRDIADLPSKLAEEGAANFTKPEVQAVISKGVVDYWPNDVIHNAQHQVGMVKTYEKKPELFREAATKLNIDNAAYNFDNAADIVKLRGHLFDGLSADGKVINDAMYNDAVFEQAFNDLLMNAHVAPWKRMFQYRSGKEQVIHPYDSTKNALSHALGSYQDAIAKMANSHRGNVPGTDTTILAQAFRDIATGAKSSKVVEAARKDLEPFVKTVFGDPADKNAMGIWEYAGADLNDMQVYMNKAKIQYEVDFTNAETKFGKGEYSSVVAAGMDDWKLWASTVDDPARFLMDMHYAGFMLHADKTAAALFVAKTGMTSKVAEKGFTKIPDSVNLYEHPLIGHMPKGTYIKDDILKEVHELERMIMQDFSPKSDVGKFMNNVYLPWLGAWKKGVTIYRPGHHVRNILSDMSIQYVQEGVRYFGRANVASARILASRKGYEGVDWAEFIAKIGDTSMPTTGNKVMTYGKLDVTDDMLWDAAMKNGLFSDYSRVEDLFDETVKTKMTGFIDKLTLKDTWAEKIAGGTSEALAHQARFGHFIQILMKEGKKGKNWQAAVESAAKKVRRSHPDGMTLTPFERAYLKPFIPFYSWFKQTAPVILEGIAMNPGRFMVYPKASYNMAVAMGVDPQSIQDPFPQNEMFPSFITNKLTGPVANIDGNYFTAAPGFAYADVLNQFVSDPKQGAMSMLTPFIKTPGELITGTRWDTGVSIKDYSDYIDAQIPGVNYLSNFTGVSTTGTVGSFLTGNGVDYQYSVDKGNKTVMDQGVSVSNWFTGFGIQNVSKQNYRNLAEIEARNAAAQAAKEAAGTARNPF